VLAGHTGDQHAARVAVADPDPVVRASGLTALYRMGALSADDLEMAWADPSATVRRRACTIAGRLRSVELAGPLVEALADHDASVVEAACWALGETWEEGSARTPGDLAALDALRQRAGAHPDPLCREAAVAALGAVGHPSGLSAVLAALNDKPAVRRRAVVALAAFEGPEVSEALERAAQDRDWQVRQTAEDLLGRRPRPS
jgi:HEAT repeat protein